MPKPKRGFARADRVADQIQRDLAELLRKGLKDPRAGWVTITAVQVARDYSHAKVFYTVMDSATRDATQAALEHSAGYLRSELGRNLQMFTTPQLVFVYDESVERGMRMDQLLAQVAREDAARQGESDEGAPSPPADEAGEARA